MLPLDKINSATKYPSIPTYHVLGEKGRLKDEVQVDFPEGEPVFVTEKIDGTNTRIICMGSAYPSYILGSREELLHAAGDLIWNPSQGIVQTILEDQWSERACAARETTPLRPGIQVFYGEVYGGKTTAAAKNYTGGDQTRSGFRVFDVAHWPSQEGFDAILGMEREAISLWRENGGQPFLSTEALQQRCGTPADPWHLPRVPEIMVEKPPRSLQDTFAWLREVLPGPTLAALPGANPGHPEGVVVRSADRKRIAKIRFEDYERTLGRKG